eukprot:scaffold24375_cov26-Tisochrysis_lutea.AAC.2
MPAGARTIGLNGAESCVLSAVPVGSSADAQAVHADRPAQHFFGCPAPPGYAEPTGAAHLSAPVPPGRVHARC